MTHFHRFALVLCCIFPLLLGTAHAQAGGNAVNIPGIGRVVINPDGTITLPGGQTIAVNPNGTITLPGGQVINLPTIPGAGGGGGGGGGGGIINPNTDPRIIAGTAIVIGDEASAAVVVPNAGGGGGLINNTATYLWTITGGRFASSDLTRANIDYTADQAGTVRLTCVVTVAGAQPFTATADVTVVDPATAGTITTTPTIAAATTATGTASVPAAQGNDRTIRWTITGTAARITAGATTNQITFIPGDPGIKELTCAVTLTAARITVTLRSFIVVQGSGPAVTLTVNGGFGGGTYPGGSRVDVFAAVPAAGQVFDRWTGDTSVLGTGPIAPLNSRDAHRDLQGGAGLGPAHRHLVQSPAIHPPRRNRSHHGDRQSHLLHSARRGRCGVLPSCHRRLRRHLVQLTRVGPAHARSRRRRLRRRRSQQRQPRRG
jgi:hypothetical protein